ncbi:carbohydrate ABC transporter permease [Halanaerobium sp. ST460_2HS_T2]|uniref:carbohydrate ABC transporter permease n=1 Tax=Halanaerobium sp. ST460_2HS_T2 TaxID=2183914 RepID=UPI000DF23FEF|nr:sugar ABC transporter permease [Halanaerobium sp. ST460_2HS_T2]RCW55357.1 multiple sugar transport system permease protein [Halanaerobium sp. ST460_2HS_T2]
MIKIKTNSQIASQKALIILVSILMISFYSVFSIGPMIYAFVGSFANWNPIKDTFQFIQFNNYIHLFNNPLFWTSLKNTIYFVVVVVTGRVVLGFLIALGLNSIKKYKSMMRSLYFLPVIMPIVAVALVWKWLYDPNIGFFQMLLSAFGITNVKFLFDKDLALPSIMLMTIWKDVGYAVIIFLAGLMDVPQSIIEASEIDGANKRQQLWNIIIPTLKPTLIFVIITSIISYFQTFTQIFIMTKGGPGTSTHVLLYMIYREAFQYYRFGYASAITVCLFIVIMIVTFIQFKIMKGGEV